MPDSSGANPFISIDGASYNQEFQTGAGKFSYGLYVGSPKLNSDDAGVVTTKLNNAYGAQINLEGSGWKIHGSVTKWSEELTINAPLTASFGPGGKVESTLYTIGGRYDKNNIVIWSEILARKNTDASKLTNGKEVVGDINAGYAMIGYRMGKYLPRLTFAQNDIHTGFTTGKVSTAGVGVNYQVADTAVIKVDFERWMLSNPQESNTTATVNTKNTKDYANAVYAGVDFIF